MNALSRSATPYRAATSGGDPSATAYEELRGLAVAGAVARGRLGVIILLREGVATWMVRRGDGVEAAGIAPPPDRWAGGPGIADEVHAGVVRVLASMVLAGKEKETTA